MHYVTVTTRKIKIEATAVFEHMDPVHTWVCQAPLQETYGDGIAARFVNGMEEPHYVSLVSVHNKTYRS